MKPNVERLAILAAHLRKIHYSVPLDGEPPLFNIGTWQNACGTAACAVGHACYIPQFREAGLHMQHYLPPRHAQPEPRFGLHTGWDAASVFFGLTHPQTTCLFDGYRYPEQEYRPTALQVAERIEKFIQELPQ
jgi:hypothetical protein